jgi:hypothetical protein
MLALVFTPVIKPKKDSKKPRESKKIMKQREKFKDAEQEMREYLKEAYKNISIDMEDE